MKCFIHGNEEAIAVCKICGKGMCANCSAYSAHKGICPECRLEEFKRERTQKYSGLSNANSEIKWNTFYAIILSWTLVGLAYFLYKRKEGIKEKNNLELRINSLDKEITKLSKILKNTGRAVI